MSSEFPFSVPAGNVVFVARRVGVVRRAACCLRVRDLETDQTILGPLYAKNMGGPFKTWVRGATNQTEDRKEATPAANYLLIPDLAAKDVEVLTAPGSSLCGIQIVERQATGK